MTTTVTRRIGAVTGLIALAGASSGTFTDKAVPRFTGADGALQNTGVIIDDSDNLSTLGKVSAGSPSLTVATINARAAAGSSAMGYFEGAGASDATPAYFFLRDVYTGSRSSGSAGDGNGPLLSMQSYSRRSGGTFLDSLQMNGGLVSAGANAEYSLLDIAGYRNGTSEVFFTIDAQRAAVLPGDTVGIYSLGDTIARWKNLYLAASGKIDWSNGGIAIREASDILVFEGATGGYVFDGPVSGSAFAPTGGGVPANGLYLPAANTLGWAVNSTAALQLTSSALSPISNDGVALGTASLSYSDLFLASGAVINIANGDVTITHASDKLTFAGAASGFQFSNVIAPSSNDGAAIGTTALQWSDLFLATGGVINWANGGITITEVSDILSFAGASGGYLFDATIIASAFAPNSGGVPSNGMYLSAANTLGWATNSIARLTLSTTTLDLAGTMQVDALRIDQTPTAVGTGTKTISNGADSSTNLGHYISINANGTTYFIPCGATALT